MNKIIIANWKMNPQSQQEAQELTGAIRNGIDSQHPNHPMGHCVNTNIVLCPPFVFMEKVKQILNKSKIMLGAQNIFHENSGSFTGEISAPMIKSLGCEYAILGHSERKKYFFESLDDINKKIISVLKSEMTPVVCLEDLSAVAPAGAEVDQLETVLQNIPKEKLNKIIFVYEPAWAISDGKNPSNTLPDSNDVLSAKLLIQKFLSSIIGKKKALETRIIYGGSVNAKNVKDYVGKNLMDGALIGGASLRAKEFIKIINIVEDMKC
ncbi:triose-phosphate isomerase [bacterium]|nr:MAG: triose-phosphate isomerase [bacterium]